MQVVTIDFETYYDKEYSLSKMTTENYIRDSRFEVIGVGRKVGSGDTEWYSGDDVAGFLNSMDYSNAAILAHNCVFDGAILSWKYGVKPKLWLDTMSMARPLTGATVRNSLAMQAAYYKLGNKGSEVVNALGMRRRDFDPAAMQRYATYCINDVDLTYKLFTKIKRDFPPSEVMLIDATLRMFIDPILEVDSALLVEHLDDVVNRKASLVASMGLQDTTEDEAKKILMSNALFAEYLRKLGVEPPTKISPRTGKVAFAFSKTDTQFKALLDHPNETVSNAVAARVGVKSTIEETRTKSLLGVAERGPLPIMLNYYGAHTGRFSGGDKMNLQNLPRGGQLRRSLRAPEGKMLVACDSAQIEARMVAWVAGEDDLLQAFAEGRDVYSEFASKVYGYGVTKADHKVERHVGKTCILGLGYGMGAEKFRNTLASGQGGVTVDMPLTQAGNIVQMYRSEYSRIAGLWSKCNSALNAMVNNRTYDINPVLTAKDKQISLPNGLAIKYAGLEYQNSGYRYIASPRDWQKYLATVLSDSLDPAINWTYIYGGKVTENCVQALARIVVAEQLLAIARRYKVVLQVHDEVVIVCDESEVHDAQAFMMEEMSKPPSWASDLPVACEASFGENYAECK